MPPTRSPSRSPGASPASPARDAHLVSQVDGRAAYGGTPSDATVVAAIQDLQGARPRRHADALPLHGHPRRQRAARPLHRRRTASRPIPGAAASPSRPPPASPAPPTRPPPPRPQVAAFVGTADVADFAIDGDSVVYSGPDEWSYRRFILHYAHLAAGRRRRRRLRHRLASCAASPRVRDSASTYPFVAALVALAADVKAVLGPATKVTYAADWSEYFGHQPADGSGDVYFHLDPLWASAAIDAVGIDVYWPLADWRDGTDPRRPPGRRPLDLRSRLPAAPTSPAARAIDWYYASPADRDAQVRTPITDGAAGKPWVFRFKDIRAWWLNQHFDRPGGIESATPTAWVPQSKPFWFTELGCPAVDRAPTSPTSSSIRRAPNCTCPTTRTARATTSCSAATCRRSTAPSTPTHPATSPAPTRVSSVYAGRMVDLDHMHVYAWDARPYPAFPADTDTWGDGPNWRLGHWITGRLASAPLDATVAAMLADYGFAAHDAVRLDRPARRPRHRPRAVRPRGPAAAGARLLLRRARERRRDRLRAPRRGRPAAELTTDDLVETRPDERARHPHARAGDRPAGLRQAHLHLRRRRLSRRPSRKRAASPAAAAASALADLPLVLEPEQAARDRRVLAVRGLGRARARQLRPAAEPPRARARRRSSRSPPTAARACCASPRSASTACAISRRAASIPTSMPPRPAPSRGRAAPSSSSASRFVRVPRPAAAARRRAARTPATSPPPRAPGRARIAFYRSPESLGLPAQGRWCWPPASPASRSIRLPAGATSRFDRATSVRVKLDRARSPPSPSSPCSAAPTRPPSATTTASGRCCSSLSAVLTAPATYAALAACCAARPAPSTPCARRSPPAPASSCSTARSRRVDMTEDEVGLAFNWRCGPASRDIGSPTYVEVAHAFTGRGLKPLSPVHVRGTRSAGDLALTWMRRTRIGGDSWDGVEVPLGEDEERYEIDILDGATVKRTLTATSPTATYTAAQQTADFGSPQPSIALRIYQLSTTRGRGTPRAAVL